MNVSRKWLEALLGRSLDASEVTEQLAMLGTLVDAVEPVAALDGVVVAQVKSVEGHPDADRLSVCQVDDGEKVHEVICGAPNVRAGGVYPFAPVGTTLPSGLKLTKRKIRGIVSNGMLCSAKELELGEDQDGILELETEVALGTPVILALGLDDERLVLDVTANRGDLLGVRGVARELAAVSRSEVKLPEFPGEGPAVQPPVRAEGNTATTDGMRITIEDVEGCPRFLLGVIRGVRVGLSPLWLQNRLRAVGQRPVNNVVDATNYILFELNHPTHAYDFHRVGGSEILVRRAPGESLRTLDGVDRKLDGEMTAICDGEGVTGVGGVMGGERSEVSDATVDLAVECAVFEPKRIRKSRRALGMTTEASHRFERGIDEADGAEVLRRLMELIVRVAGGEVREAPVDVWPKPPRPRSIFLRPARVEQVLGLPIAVKDIERSLSALGCVALPKEGNRLAVQVPTWRNDLVEEIDLVEEVARIVGYDAIPDGPRPYRTTSVPESPIEAVKKRVRESMVAEGLLEAQVTSLGAPDSERAVLVSNPLSAEEAYLRGTLLPGLVRRAEFNWANRIRDIRLFEVGTVFAPGAQGELPVESTHLAAVLTGAVRPPHWTEPAPPDVTQWELKGMLARAVALSCPAAEVRTAEDGWVAVDPDTGRELGRAGAVEADRPPWAGALFGMELVLAESPRPAPTYQELPTTPPVERDLALIVPTGIAVDEVAEVVRRSAGPLLESAEVFDEYRGDGIPAGTRSVAFRLTYRHPTRTLRETEAERSEKKALAALEEQLGVRRREN